MGKHPTDRQIQDAYAMARERYAALGVDTDEALEALAGIGISLHCWQGDDVGGFESSGGELGSGLAVTGSYPGRARNGDELRRDLDKAYNLIPGTHRLNLHAIYAETGGRRVERNELQPEHFSAWIDWARDRGHGVDFNPRSKKPTEIYLRGFFVHTRACAQADGPLEFPSSFTTLRTRGSS